VAGSLAACGGPAPVTVRAPSASPAAAAACTRLTTALPEEVRGQSRRTVEPSSDRTAAWGDPPIVVTCGVPRPPELQAESTLLTVDGVDWFVQPLTRGTRFTSTGRVAYVRVEVPEDYTSASDALSDLDAAVRRIPLAPIGS
jgi:hypothetical protein